MESYFLSRREVLSIIFKEKRLLISVFLVISIATIIFSYIITPKYEAMAEILINSGQEFQTQADAGKQVGSTPYLTKQEIINSELEILESHDLLEAVVTQVGVARLYPKIAANPPANMRPVDAAVDQFSKDLKIQAVTMSEVITLSYYNADRATAIQALSALIQLYQTKHASVFGETRASYFATQLKTYEAQLDDTSEQIADLREQKSLFDVAAQQSQLIQDRSQVVDVLQSLESKSVDAHGRIGYYQNRLKSLSPLVTAGETQSDAVETAKGKLLDLQVQLVTMRQRYTSDTKPIQDTLQQIGAIQDFIAGRTVANKNVWQQRDPAYDDANLKMQQAEADAASMDAQIVLEKQHLQEFDSQLNDLVGGAHDLEALERNHDMLDDLVRTIRTRYEEAKASEDLDKQNVGSVNVLAEPDASTKPAKPKHTVFALVGCGLGLFGVAAVLIYLVAFRDTLITAESVDRLLGIKVLGVVPFNTTRQNYRPQAT